MSNSVKQYNAVKIADDYAGRESDLQQAMANAADRVFRVEALASQGVEIPDSKADAVESDRNFLAAAQQALQALQGPAQRFDATANMPWRRDPVKTVQDYYTEFSQIIASGDAGKVTIPSEAWQFNVTSANSGNPTWTPTTSKYGDAPFLTDICQGRPANAPAGLTVSGPLFDALAAVGASAEGALSKVQADPTTATATLARFNRLITLSNQVRNYGVGADAIGRRLAVQVANEVNSDFVSKMITTAGVAVTFAGSAQAMIDKGVGLVWKASGERPGIIVVNSADYALLGTRTNSGGDAVGEPIVAYNGVPVGVNDAVAAGFALVVSKEGFTAFRSSVTLSSAPKLDTGESLLMAECYATVLPHYVGAASYVDIVSP